MPTYRIELQNGAVFDVETEGDAPPSEQDVLAHIAKNNLMSMDHQPARPEDFAPQRPRGSVLGRFASGAWQNLNPLEIARGVGQAITSPIETGRAIVQAQADQFGKASTAYQQGRYAEMIGHGAAGALPLIGPAAATAGEAIGSGDVAGGLGQAAGLVVPVVGTRPAVRATRALPGGARTAIAARLQRGAASRVADVMAPKVGPNKTRFGNQAERVAPALAQDTSLASMSREGFHAKIGERLAQAEASLDAASAARNPNAVVHTRAIIADLERKRAEMTSQSHRLGTFRAGQDVVPAPNAARVAQIDQAIQEISELGPVANYEALRRIRQAYDGPAKAVYSPSMTADYLKAQGSKLGAADVTGTLRETLAKMDPQTAAANADYHLYRTADDVLQATAETERSRPRVGRQIIARSTGAVVGGQQAGVVGAVAGFALGPIVEAALSSGVTTKLQTARLMTDLANAIRAGQSAKVATLQESLRRLASTSARQVPAEPAMAMDLADQDQ